MSPGKKKSGKSVAGKAKGSGTGKALQAESVHHCPPKEPCHQCDDDHTADGHPLGADSKPDFDERDRGVKPTRKPSGPTQRKRRASTMKKAKKTAVEPSPEANIIINKKTQK